MINIFPRPDGLTPFEYIGQGILNEDFEVIYKEPLRSAIEEHIKKEIKSNPYLRALRSEVAEILTLGDEVKIENACREKGVNYWPREIAFKSELEHWLSWIDARLTKS